MRRIIGGVFASLDGVMQAPGGPEEDPTGGFTLGGWSTSFWDDSMMAAMGALMGGDFDLLLGRRTYEIFAGHWPFQKGDPFAQKLNDTAKHVVTSSTAPLAWENSHALRGNADALRSLKSASGPDLIVQGSSQLYPLLLGHGLLDRLLLMTFPVVLGNGRRLFAGGAAPGAFKLVDHKVSSTGVLIATYEPAGAVPIGTFAQSEPSAPELARRERMRREG